MSLVSAAENIEADIDHIKENRSVEVGAIHLNIIRRFPEAAVVEVLASKKNIKIIERTDEPMAGDNPLARDVRTALTKALTNHAGNPSNIPAISPEEMPRIYSGIYGLGPREFRPEDILGAYEYTQGKIRRQDGKHKDDGESYFTLGINHPYNVRSTETPSILPKNAITVNP